ncbi:MAG: outer membrane beta-barrel protein [Bacteroidota bacterium]
MNENLHDIDKLFHDSLEGHEELPSDKVWDNLDHTLDQNSSLVARKKYNNLKRLSVALLLLLIASVSYQFYNSKSHDSLVGKNKTNETEGDNKEAVTRNKAVGPEKKNTTAANGENASNINDVSPVAAAEHATLDKTTDTANSARKVISDNTSSADESSVSKKEAGNSSAKNSNNIKTKGKNDNRIASNSPAPVMIAANKNKLSANLYSDGKSRHPETQPVQLNSDQQSIQSKTTGKKNNGNDTYNKRTIISESKMDNAVIAERNLSKAALIERADDAVFNFYPQIQIHDDRNKPGIELQAGSSKISVIKKSPPFHFTVMPFFSPQFSFNRIENDDNPARSWPGGPVHDDRNNIKKEESHETSYSWGVLVEIPLGKKWSLQSGVHYLNRTVTIDPKKVFAQLDTDGKIKYRFDCSSGYTYLAPKTGTTPAVGDSMFTGGGSNNLQYLGVPLIVNYTFLTGKFNIIPSVGVMANFLVKQSMEASFQSAGDKQDFTSINGLKKTYFNTLAGIALQYNTGKHVSVVVAPTFNLALNSINQNAAVKSYPNSFGITGGIKIQF